MAKRNYFKRILAGTLAILTVAGYMPANVGGLLTGGVEIVANAGNIAGIHPNIVSTNLYEDNTHLKELTAEFYWPHGQVSTALVLLDKDIRVQGQELSNTYSNIATTYEESLQTVQRKFEGTTEFGKTDFEVTNSQTTYQRNIVFPENKLSANDTSKQYYLYLWTNNGNSVYPDMLIAVLQANEDGFFCYQLGDDDNFSYTPTTTGTKIKKSQNLTVDAADKLYNNQNYDGVTIEGAQVGTQTITYSGRNETDYAASQTAPTAIGDYTVTVAYSGDDEYASASASADFSIVKAQNISAYGYDSNNPDAEKNKVYVKVSNDSESFSDVIASVDTADEYYYGQMPTKDEIHIQEETYGAIVSVADDDFYITKKGDKKASRLDIDELNFDDTYIVNTVIHVEADGKGYDFNIKKEFTYSPRPLWACDVFYQDKDGNEQKLTVDGNASPYDTVTFNYDGDEKTPVIKFRNPYNGDELTLDKEIYIPEDGTSSATDANSYSFGIYAKENTDEFTNNYAEYMNFNWAIAQAAMDIQATPNGKVYNSLQATEDDFTFTGKHADLLQADDTTMTIEFGMATATAASITGLQKANTVLANTTSESAITSYTKLINNYLKGMTGKYIENDFTLTENENFQFGQITVDGESVDSNANIFSTADIARNRKVLLLTGASFVNGILNMSFETTVKIPVTDGTSAGSHTAVITISNPNYLDTVLTVPFEISKRLVTITPEKEQSITYGDETIPKIAYIVEDQNDAENTGFIDDDLAEGQTRADFFGDIVKVGEYVDNADATTYLSYNGRKNNAGQYRYEFSGALINATSSSEYQGIQLSENAHGSIHIAYVDNNDWAGYKDVNFKDGVASAEFYFASTYPGSIEIHLDSADGQLIGTCQIQNTGAWTNHQTASCELDSSVTGIHDVYLVFRSTTSNSFINVVNFKLNGKDTTEFDNYTVKLADSELFTVSPKELTKGMFKFTGDSVLTYNEKVQNAPEWACDDGKFADGTEKLTMNDFTIGGPDKAIFPNTYNREFYGQGNYTGEAILNWAIAEDASNSVYVTAEGFTYDGLNADEHKAVSVTNTAALPAGTTFTYNYYKADDTTDLTEITAETVAKLEKVSVPADAGTYIVAVSASKKGYNISSGYASFEIAKDEVKISVNELQKVFGDATPSFTYTTLTDGKTVTGTLALKDYEGNVKYDNAGNVTGYEFDTSAMNVEINGTVNTNYYITTTDKFTVTPKRLEDANIIPGKSIIDETTGWALTKEGFKVVAVGADGLQTTLNDDDFDMITAARTKQKGIFSVQIAGKGNYTGYAENTIKIVTPAEAGYYVTVKNGTFADDTSEAYFDNGTVIAVTADEAPEGQTFGYWTKNGTTISYNPVYTFAVTSDNIALEAHYVEDTDNIEKYGNAQIETVEVDTVNQKLKFVSVLNVPEDCTIKYAGIVATNNAEKAENLTAENADFKRGQENPEVHSYKYTWTKSSVQTDETWYVKGYLVYTDADGNEKTIYSDMAKATLDGYEIIEEEKILGTAMIDSVNIVETNKLRFVSLTSVPADCTIQFAGIVATNDAEKAENLTAENANFVRGNKNLTVHNYKYTWTKSNVQANETWYVKSYLVYTDAKGKTYTVYGDLRTGTLKS